MKRRKRKSCAAENSFDRTNGEDAATFSLRTNSNNHVLPVLQPHCSKPPIDNTATIKSKRKILRITLPPSDGGGFALYDREMPPWLDCILVKKERKSSRIEALSGRSEVHDQMVGSEFISSCQVSREGKIWLSKITIPFLHGCTVCHHSGPPVLNTTQSVIETKDGQKNDGSGSIELDDRTVLNNETAKAARKLTSWENKGDRSAKNIARVTNPPGRYLFSALLRTSRKYHKSPLGKVPPAPSTVGDACRLLSMCCHPKMQRQVVRRLREKCRKTLYEPFIPDQLLCNLKEILGQKIRLHSCSPLDVFSHYGDCFVLDVVLNRTDRDPCFWTGFTNDLLTERIFLPQTETDYLHNRWDHLFRTIVIVFPVAGVFATEALSVRKLSEEDVVFAPVSWLRLHTLKGNSVRSAFIKKVHGCWAINYTKLGPDEFLSCEQLNDEENGAPLLPPEMGFDSVEKNRAAYTIRLLLSPKYRYGCRRFLEGALYGAHLPPFSLAIDPRALGDVILNVTTRNMFGQHGHCSQVRICMATGDQPLMRSLDVIAGVLHSLPMSYLSNSRNNTGGDCGAMVGIGKLVAHDGTSINDCTIAHKEKSKGLVKKLPVLCKLVAKYAENKYPGFIALVRWIARSAGLSVPEYLGGVLGVGASMAVSRNLMNASHVDSRDGSTGLAIYAEVTPGDAKNWRFVYPNIRINFRGRLYNGLAVDLSHGLSILWDGREIRHGTTIHDLDEDNNSTFGLWFGANGATFDYAHRQLVENPDVRRE